MPRGSVTRRGDSWRIAVELEPDPGTGRRRQKFETFQGTKKDAEKHLTDLLSQADRGLLQVTPRMTMSEYLDRWLKDYASTKAPKTYADYELVIRRYVVPYIGNVALDKLRPTHIVALHSKLREAPRADGREGHLSGTTQKHAHRVLHTALECAVKWQLISRNPASSVDAPRAAHREMQAFNLEQAQAFLAATVAIGTKWQTFYTTFLTTGLRIGELVGLRWQDVDLDALVLSVRQNIQFINGMGFVVGSPKTVGSRRPVALGADVVSLLRRHRAEQHEMIVRLGTAFENRGLVFPSERGTPLTESTIHKTFTVICETAGVPRIRPYDLRHSCATLLLASGVHPKVVAERLGHSTVNLTLNTYSHVLPTLQHDAANTLDSMLKRTRDQ
jgi:integrase